MTPFAALELAPAAMADHAPVLLVLGPMIGACAAALAPGPRWAWLISVAASAFAFWMALVLASEVARTGTISYALGGFEPPYGIEFRIDATASFFALLVSTMGLAAAVYSGHGLEAEVRVRKRPLFQGGFLLCLTGLLGMAGTGDAFNAFVFIEISSIGAYALIAIGENRDRRALPAAFNYLIMGAIGATFFVIGIGFLYAVTGTLNMQDMAERLRGQEDRRAVQAGFAFVVAGLGVKAALFPMHSWLPAAYAYGPSVMGVFLSSTATKTALYLIVRMVFGVFDPESALVKNFLEFVLAPLGAAAVVICSLQALFQTELRRLLAFSSVAQVGLMMLAISTGAPVGIAAAFLHLFAHSLMKAALFMAVGGIGHGPEAQMIGAYSGGARTAPWSMTAFAIAALSLAGIPLTLGFLSKWRLMEALWQGGDHLLLVALAGGSILTLLYVGRLIEVVFFRGPRAGAPVLHEAPLGALAPLWALTLATLFFGANGSLPSSLAQAAAAPFGVVP